MAGPNEQKLRQALTARPGEIDDAALAWSQGAQGLADIGEALATARGKIADAWQGSGADAATAAFTQLGDTVDGYRKKMTDASVGLTDAATALRTAQQDYQALPVVPGEPTAPAPGAGGEVATQDEVRYLRLQGQRHDAELRREQDAAAAVTKMDSQLDAASRQLASAAPAPAATHYTSIHTGGGSPAGPAPSGGGSNGYTGLGVTGSHVGPYATADTGTHVATGHLVGSSQVAFGHGHSDVSVDGTVSGFVPGGTGSVLGSAPQLSGSTGGVAAGAVGGVGGLVGGLGGVLGALGGRGDAGGTSGVLGGLRGGTSQVLGGAAGEMEELGGTVRGTTGGVSGTSGVLGGTRGTNVLGGSSGSRAGLVAGETEPGTTGAGVRGGAMGGTGGTGSGATAGGRAGSAGGRGLGGGMAEEETAGARGARSATAAGSSGGRGAQGAAGAGESDKDERRKHLKFEDDWLDEDEMGPGVIA